MRAEGGNARVHKWPVPVRALTLFLKCGLMDKLWRTEFFQRSSLALKYGNRSLHNLKNYIHFFFSSSVVYKSVVMETIHYIACVICAFTPFIRRRSFDSHIRTPPFRAAGRYQAVITTCKERERAVEKKKVDSRLGHGKIVKKGKETRGRCVCGTFPYQVHKRARGGKKRKEEEESFCDGELGSCF